MPGGRQRTECLPPAAWSHRRNNKQLSNAPALPPFLRQALLTDLFSGNASAIPGFPSPADVTSAADLARIITQVRSRLQQAGVGGILSEG